VADSDFPPLPPPPDALLDGAALFLDFDGTLVPLEDVPDAVHVDAGLHAMLHDLRAALEGRLAIVSGRSIETLRDSFGLGAFLLAGSHGLEMMDGDGTVAAPMRLPEVDRAQAALDRFAHGKPGLIVERKTLSVGLHFRRAPQWADEAALTVTALARETGLMIQPGKMALELRPGGVDKGTALAVMMAETPMAGGTPLFIGDDVTDEEGFRAAAALGGHGILVGPARDTRATFRLEQVAAVRHYLSRYAASA
jgi:trehalose 6-phosphate phosphatase